MVVKMTKTETEKGITEMYQAMETIARNAKYRERKELLEILDSCTWFDNFGYEYYKHRLTIAQMAIDRGIKNEDIPRYMKEELDIE